MKSLKILLVFLLIAISATTYSQTAKTEAELTTFINDSLVDYRNKIQTAAFLKLMRYMNVSKPDVTNTEIGYTSHEVDSMLTARFGNLQIDTTTGRYSYVVGRTTYRLSVQDSIIAPSSLATGLIGYWNLDQNSNTLTDALGLHDITNTGGVVNQTGSIGQAVQFDTNTDILSASTFTQNIPANWTYSCRIKINTINPIRDMELLAIQTSAPSIRLEIKLMSNNTIRVSAKNTVLTTYTTNTIGTALASANTWYKITIMSPLDGGRARVFVNNTELSNSTSETVFSGTGTTDAFKYFHVGNYPSASTSVDGFIDEVGFWGRHLNSTEMETINYDDYRATYPFNP